MANRKNECNGTVGSELTIFKHKEKDLYICRKADLSVG